MSGSEAQHAKEAIAAMRAAHDESVAIVGHLSGGDLQAQSGATDWTVADVLSHLGSAAEIALGTLISGSANIEGIGAIWDHWNALSPDEKAGNFITHESRLVEALEAESDEALSSRKLDLGFLPEPISIHFFTLMRLSEMGLHRWDIDVAFDPDATVPAVTVPFILDVTPNFAGYFSKPIDKIGLVAVRTVDPERDYVLELGEKGATLTRGQASDAGTAVSIPAEAFLRLTGGRLAPAHTPSAVTVSGDLTLDDLRGAFPGY